MTDQGAMLGTAREWAIDLSVATAIGAFLGVVGPFGSYFNGPVLVRCAYWIGCFWAGVVIFGLLIRLAVAGAERFRVPVWTLAGAAILAGCVLQAILVANVATTLWPFLKRLTALDWLGQCLTISAPIAVAHVYARGRLEKMRVVPVIGPASGGQAPAPPLVAAGVLYLKMEDHYVRVRTETGSRLEAGPMARVLEGLSGLDGLQVHRSWWVARRAVARVER
ncbi:MAG: LytTR family DNA-binding domain-containing protein, partial [Caulobacter sp.]